MTDYKDTLNLPATDFPMKANLSTREPELLKIWQENKLYEAIREARKDKPPFIFHDGPPYANGNIHLGHALNKILKDIIVKSKTLEGFNTEFIPGWDCHGLPIELNVEKKYGRVGEKLNPKEFREKCREYAQSQVNIQREEFKRLGVLADWNHPYLTMDFKYEANIVRALGKIIENKHLIQGFKPVHWCCDCRSSLAEAEVEYQDKTSPAIDVKFRVVDSDWIIPIWTTTPWTLPANEAVALNPEHIYVLVEANGEKLILVKELVENALSRYGVTDYKIIKELARKDLENLRLQHPFYDKQVPVVLGEHVTVDTGTGAVHTAPAHGMEDYLMGLQYHLPIVDLVDEKGCFREAFEKSFIFKANPLIIELLKSKHNLLCETKVQHSYPHCWRHKSPVIFRATPQWFISMDKNNLRKKALTEIQKVNWIPEWGQSRIYNMVENRPDWCVSRQRQWCMPMCLVVHKETKQLHPNMSGLLDDIAKQIEEKGIEAWYDWQCEDKDYEKITDTLDVWFDSGVSHFAVLQGQVADLYLEGSDQHRGWFHSSLLTAVAMFDRASYKTVLTHGFTIDEHGRKMSKSLGNGIEPDKVMKTLGADILRLWVAATDYRAEMALSNEILQRIAEAYRRIRNTARFLLANLFDFDPDKNSLPVKDLLSLDQWIIQKAKSLQEEIREAYKKYEFHLIYQKLHNFCVVELGGFYLDIIKDRQYTMQKNSKGRRSAQTAIYIILQAFVRWIAPILSFTAEEISQFMPGQKESIFLAEWFVFPEMPQVEINFDVILKLRLDVNKELESKRNQKEIGSGLEADVKIIVPDELYQELYKLGEELRFVWITSKASIQKGEQLSISVSAVNDPKCARCWHRRDDVGKHAEHPEICIRCVDNLPEGKGEERHYA